MNMPINHFIIASRAYSQHDYVRSKPNIIENGVRMENLLRFRVGNIISLSVRKAPHLPMCSIFVRKLWSLSFQPRWFHLIWSSNEKVMTVLVSVVSAVYRVGTTG